MIRLTGPPARERYESVDAQTRFAEVINVRIALAGKHRNPASDPTALQGIGHRAIASAHLVEGNVSDAVRHYCAFRQLVEQGTGRRALGSVRGLATGPGRTSNFCQELPRFTLEYNEGSTRLRVERGENAHVSLSASTGSITGPSASIGLKGQA
ncbi:hypothetical protein ACFYP4_03450 [Streptomyces sp. NPDC005551]|uniref:hypothetical protein n=1 Tax=Streptomyces sp. NPDC005551 TaxID=3364725 RepID=UPI0036CFB158